MIIQINTDRNISNNEEFRASLETFLIKELSRYASHITRLDVHLSDENGNKNGVNDKKCLIEAHMERKEPIVVKNHANNFDASITGAIDKLKASLNSTIERSKNY